jgi:cytoskeletal protein CcmA (bactofilin family)
MFSKSERPVVVGQEPVARVAPSLISANLQIVGNLKSEGEVQIDGRVDGDVAAISLVIGDRADIHGEVIADDVSVRGAVHGRIRARNVQLAKTAHVVGDIWHETLAIEAGAFVEGHCKRSDKATENPDARVKSLASVKRESIELATAKPAAAG